ncbi:MAG: hypothetical protein AAGA42_11205 [Actinomycetota bacterium]
MTHHQPPIDPVQLAQSLAMSPDMTDRTRDEVIIMLEELAERRRRDPWPNSPF